MTNPIETRSSGAETSRAGGPGPGAAILMFVLLLAIAAGAHHLAQRRDGAEGAPGSGGTAGTAGADTTGARALYVDKVVSDDTLEAVTVGGGSRHVIRSRQFRKGDAVAILGRSEIDFSEAELAAAGGRIDAVVLFANLEIRVPRDWAVERDNEMVFSRFKDRTGDPGTAATKRLRLDGVTLFGAIEVTH